MTTRYEMGSPEWLAALHACIVAVRPRAELKRDITFCEVYTDVPPHIPSDGGTIAFTVRLRKDSQDVDFERREAGTADMKLRIAYSHVVPLGRFIVGNDPERQREYGRMVARALSGGHASVQGAPPEELAQLGVHDLIAKLTA